ncbi:hypothetical protein ACQPXS_01695 [Streptomyces sp. CA-142005]|uniref:hypothetical protein n=1 Tax=Streptomyces sp. CA-142005 TaxID=3240052 RepID=UPI003D8F12EE
MRRPSTPASSPGAGTAPPSLLAFAFTDGHLTESTAVVDPAEPAPMDLPTPV